MTEPRSVLITGCSAGGIGHALALEYHAKGCRVFATARRLDSMAELAAQGITTLELDACDADSVESVKGKVTQLNDGRLDILVNNAGKYLYLPSTDQNMTDVREMFDINVFAVMVMTTAFVPLLRKSLLPHGAKVINVSSVAGVFSLPFSAAYTATKAALNAYGDSLRLELRPFKINVITVITGLTKSNVMRNSENDLPPDSLYAPMADSFYKLRFDDSNKARMPTGEYAARFVKQTIKPTPAAYLWLGPFAFTFRVLNAVGWRGFWDNIIVKQTGLGKLAKHMAKQR